MKPNQQVTPEAGFLAFAKHRNVRFEGTVSLEDRASVQLLVNKENWVGSPELILSQVSTDVLLHEGWDMDMVRRNNPPRPGGSALEREIVESMAEEIPFLGFKSGPGNSGSEYFIPLFKGQREGRLGLEKSDNTLDFENDKATAKVRFYRQCNQ